MEFYILLIIYMKKTKTLSNNNLAFTLVELIVVIVILAILTTVAFIYIWSYVKYSRDSKRITDIRSVANVIDIKLAKWMNPWNFLSPPPVNKTFSWDIIMKEWIVDDNMIIKLNDLSKTPIDPVTNDYYKYSTTSKWTFYQIFSNLERWNWINSTIVPKTYAVWEWAKIFKIVWNYNWLFLVSSEWKYYSVPSLFIDDRWIDDEWYARFYLDWKTETVRHKIIEVASKIPSTDDEKYAFAIKMYYSYVWTWLNENIFKTLDINNRDDVIKFWTLLLNQRITAYKSTEAVNWWCVLDWTLVASWSSITAYSESSIAWYSLYSCDWVSQVRTCSNWVFDWDDEYKYTSCIKWNASACSADNNYLYNEHTYNLPWLEHSETNTSWVASNPIIENHWTYTYTLDSVSCNDGSFINFEESGPTIVCDDWYSQVWSSCVLSWTWCIANPSYVYNLHPYNIPELSHYWSYSWTTLVSENNWTFIYSLDNITCNDWSYIDQIESGPTLSSCNTWYTASWSTCIASWDITITWVDTVICSWCTE